MKPERRSGTRQIVRIQVIMPILQMESCDTIGMALFFLNKKNEEKWIQSTQLKNPIIEVKEKAFAVGRYRRKQHSCIFRRRFERRD